MVSAKSSPLMFADMREVKMGVAYSIQNSGGQNIYDSDGEPVDGDDGMRLRKKWLGLTKLWKEK